MRGTENSDRLSFGSSCHGAGRVMSRAKAKQELKGDRLLGELEKEGINLRAASMSGLQRCQSGCKCRLQWVIARKVARLRLVAVIKE